MKRIAGFVVLLTLGALLFWWVMSQVGWNSVWQGTRSFWGSKGLAVVGLTFLMLFFGAWRWREILRHQGYHLSFLMVAREYVTAFSISFFAPMLFFANEFFRAYVLRDLHKVPLQRGVVSLLIERLLEATTYLAIIILGALYLVGSNAGSASQAVWWGAAGIALVAALLVFFYVKSQRRESILKLLFPRLKKDNGFLEMEKEVLRFFRLRNRAFWEGMALSAARASSSVLRTFVLVAFLGEFLGFFQGIAITAFTFLSLMVPIPGQLGSHEVLQAFAFQAVGLQGYQGATFAFLARAAELVAAVAGLVLLVKTSMVLLERSLLKKLERIFLKLPL